MKRKNLLWILCFLWLPYSTFFASFESANIKEIFSEVINEKKHKKFQDLQKKEFSVIYTNNISQDQENKILKAREIFLKWPQLEIKQMIFTLSTATIEIWILPTSFETSFGDITPYMPSGMTFYFTDALFFDFRMKKEQFFFKMRGNYLSFENFISQIHKALENPFAYIRLYDPDYYLLKMEEYSQDLEKLKVLANKQEKELETLRNAVIYLHNSGFLSGSSAINQNTLKKVIDLKKANPKLSKADLKKELEKDKIKISSQEIDLIFAVYFNHF